MRAASDEGKERSLGSEGRLATMAVRSPHPGAAPPQPCSVQPKLENSRLPGHWGVGAHLTVPSSFSSMFLMPLFMRTSPPRAAVPGEERGGRRFA